MFPLDPPLDGHENMARDREILARAEAGQLGVRIYQWDGPWVSLGRFQHPERDLVDLKATKWTLRPTGGKAVLHGHDLTVGLAIPLARLGLGPRDLKPAYRLAVQPIVEALKSCGVDATLAEGTKWGSAGRSTADCFAFRSPNDVVDRISGRKLCGVALRITDSAILVQASIPRGRPLVEPSTRIRGAVELPSEPWNWEPFAAEFSSAVESQFEYSTSPT